jgi:hypothetical protein
MKVLETDVLEVINIYKQTCCYKLASELAVLDTKNRNSVGLEDIYGDRE